MTTEAAAPATTESAAPDATQDAAISAMLGLTDATGRVPGKPAPAPATKPTETKTEPKAAAAGDEDDALEFSEDELDSPEKIKAARDRLFKKLGKVNELQRKAMRAHGAASARERRLERDSAQLKDREARAAAFERMTAGAIEDLESGDPERFLTAVGKLTKSGDPASFWRNASLALAKGEKLKPAEQRAVDADPELKRRLEALEQGIAARQEQEADTQIETLKTRHLQAAQQSDAHPYVKAWATANPELAREGIAQVMLEQFQRIGRPVDISTACGIIEQALRGQYELFQRADSVKNGQNGEKGTTGPEPDAGRETSKEPPKPEVAKAQTVPASLASSPGSASRSESEEERRARQIRELEAAGWI